MNEVLRFEVGRLPRLFRDVVLLRDIQGLPLGEVARRLGISVPAAKSRLVRARAKLHFQMTTKYPGVAGSPLFDGAAAPLRKVTHHSACAS
jgi:RNA polymerase sigma-70 factor (ECF subfamily)